MAVTGWGTRGWGEYGWGSLSVDAAVSGVETAGFIGTAVASIPKAVPVAGVQAEGQLGYLYRPITVTVSGVSAAFATPGVVHVIGEANMWPLGVVGTISARKALVWGDLRTDQGLSGANTFKPIPV